MKEELNKILNKSLNNLEIYLSNGQSYSIYKPNETDAEAGKVELEESGARIIVAYEDGCTSETYIPYSNMTYFFAIYDCPKKDDTENS